MKCPECEKLGLRSKVFVGQATRTLMGYTSYYDEDGKFHNNNPNKTTTSYTCSNGHAWMVKR